MMGKYIDRDTQYKPKDTSMEIDLQGIKAVVPVEALAKAFCLMGQEQQAQFFAHCHSVIMSEYKDGMYGFKMQMEHCRCDNALNVNGRVVQKIIGGDY